jgi:hypothetical protein
MTRRALVLNVMSDIRTAHQAAKYRPYNAHRRKHAHRERQAASGTVYRLGLGDDVGLAAGAGECARLAG